MAVDVGGVMAGGGVPGDGDGLASELERDCAVNGAGGPVAGLPGAEDLPGVFYRDLDGPPGRVPLDDLGGGRGRGLLYHQVTQRIANAAGAPGRP